MEKEETPVYIGLDDPVTIRKTLLESLKANIHCLQEGERLKEIRANRHAEVAHFKELTAELYDMVAELKKNLPRLKMKKQKPTSQVHVKEPGHPVVKHTSELDRLEGELKQIESKLRVLQ